MTRKRQVLQREEYSIWLVEDKRPYPVIFKDDRVVNVLTSHTSLPHDIQQKFWRLLSVSNIFKESTCPEGYSPEMEEDV